MSEHNPFDDEEQFTEQAFSVPLDSDVTRTITDLDILLMDVTKQVKEHFNKTNLNEVTLSFEYADTDGYTSWVATHYRRK
jgi:hypothetical protein